MAKDKPKPTGLALQQIQAKDFETSVDLLFPSIVTVLQDSGYRIVEADKTSGFVSGIGSAEQKITFNLWFGVGKKKNVPMVSAFVEQRGPNVARARLNFVLSKAKSRDSFTDDIPISDPEVYKDAFERIEKELFVRIAMAVPSPTIAAPSPALVATPQSPPTPTSPAVVPAAATIPAQ